MSLRLLFNSPASTRPKAGQLYLMHTTIGDIPVGISSTEAFFGAAALIHPYRALLTDPADTSFYDLISDNTLLLPPLQISKTDFRQGGCFTRVTDKNAPQVVPFERYYYYQNSMPWSPEEQAFVVAAESLPTDRLGTFVPKHERHIHYTLHGTNPPQGGIIDNAPEGTYFMPHGFCLDMHVEFALEDALCHHGLIDSLRPAHPDFSEPAAHPRFHLTEIKGASTVYAGLDAISEKAVGVIEKAKLPPTYSFVDNLTKYVLHASHMDAGEVETSTKGHSFSVTGPIDVVEALQAQLNELFNNPDELASIIDQARKVGVDLGGQELFQLADVNGTATMFTSTGTAHKRATKLIKKTGHSPNRHFFDALARYLLSVSGTSHNDIEFDGKSGMFRILGPTKKLTPLKDHLTALFNNPAEFEAVFNKAVAAGVEFDN